MTEVRRILLSKILIGERQRPIDNDYARVIGASMAEHGQLQPILLRMTPAAERPYTLVIGGHRVTGAALFSIDRLDAIIVKANALEAQALELAENLHRRDLTVLDRAQFLSVYRALCEEKYGPIRPGGDHEARQLLWSSEGAAGFSRAAADRLGLSKRATHYLNAIARDLHPLLKAALKNHPAADNQTQLLHLSRLQPMEQRRLAIALREEPDLRKARMALSPAISPADASRAQAAILSQLVLAWSKAEGPTQSRFLDHIGAVLCDRRREVA